MAVWMTNMGAYDSVQAAAKTAQGSWSAATMISGIGENCSYPLVVMDSAGNSVAIWSYADIAGNIRVLCQAQCPAGGSWTPSSVISSPTEDVAIFASNLTDPAYRLVINDNGAAVASWNSYLGGDLVVRAATLSGGVWSAPVTLSP